MMSMEFDDSLKTYNPGKENHPAVIWLKERPFRAASVCLGLFCVLLLTGIIILVNHHYQVGLDQSINNSNLSMKLDQLKTSNNKLIEERHQLQTSYNNLTKQRDQLHASYNSLTQERDQLQTSYNNLTKERDQLHTSYNSLTQERDQLQTSYNNLTKESDQLHTSYNNVTQERDQLQTSYNNLAKERDQLHTTNNNLTQEKDQLEKEVHRLKKGGLLANSTACLPGWKSYGGSCYLFSSCKKTWTDSRQDCLNRDADLVIINSKEEQNFVNNFCCAVWIGLHDFETESIWKWVDGSPLTWKSWAKGEPNNAGNEDCAELQPRPKTWNDVPCSQERHWVCKKLNL